MQYADVTHESESAIWRHPLAREVLAETRGIIIVYQEQVVFLLRKFARFTREEAEKCRKYISKMMPKRFDYAERFITGCMENPEFRVGTLVQGDAARVEAERIWGELLKKVSIQGWSGRSPLHPICFHRILIFISIVHKNVISVHSLLKNESRNGIIHQISLEKKADHYGNVLQEALETADRP